eukprot:CAMPEP_0184220452 /NCGR_PEP_ID=MMETSP0976-20121227/17715_1 /TAXON_ID=483370 /ORGANISM="non described non described, Strain CCMP2097" /LENGTH=244 /DNA_ID=CAMNT_0026525313 /DNA_START=82 /DNA_END=814 /DNA_ORIENTATION=+
MSAGSPTELGCRRPTPMRRIAPPPLQNIDAINDEVNGSDELSEWRRELYKAVRPRSRCQAMPCTLLPDLMMSDERGVADAARLLSLGVTHILNLAKGDTAARGEEYASCGIAYLECEAFDRPDYDVLGRHFDESFEFYRKARASPSSRLVVHCLGGVNRSGLVATALYMWATKVTLLDAATEVNRAAARTSGTRASATSSSRAVGRRRGPPRRGALGRVALHIPPGQVVPPLLQNLVHPRRRAR